MMNFYYKQFKKFVRVSFFLIENYFKALASNKQAQMFMTDIYMKSKMSDLLWKDSNLKRYQLEAIFPQIKDIAVQVYLERKSVVSGIYNPETEYLVSPNELSTICAIAKFLKPNIFFEIGTYKGWTLANVTMNLPVTTKIYSIDQHPLESSDPVIQTIRQSPNISQLQGNTFQYDFSEFEGKVDLVFVDGGHDKKTVKNDTEIALRLLSPYGTIIWHDYNLEHPGVYEYLNELSKGLDLKVIETTSMVIYSKKAV